LLVAAGLNASCIFSHLAFCLAALEIADAALADLTLCMWLLTMQSLRSSAQTRCMKTGMLHPFARDCCVVKSRHGKEQSCHNALQSTSVVMGSRVIPIKVA